MALTDKQITELTGVSEAYQTSDSMMKQLMNPEQREALLTRFIEAEDDLTFDWFTEFFQNWYSDRKDKKQDFTPDGLIKLVSKLAGSASKNVDIASGTGGLTIGRWLENPDTEFYLEEFSDASVPFLLFNLAIRNTNAVVRHGDSLHQDFKATYKLTKGARFSSIEMIEEYEHTPADTTVMNPPFSMSWKRPKSLINDPRFKDFGLAPASKSDYAFLLTGLSKLSDDGVLVAIDSPGILFRSTGGEDTIRQNLLEANLVDAIILLPDNLFLKTTTSTVIVIFKKNKTNKDVLVIDATTLHEREGKYNVITQENRDTIHKIYSDRVDVPKIAHVATLDEIKANDFNLNVPRYVDTFDPEPEIDLYQNYLDLTQVDKEIEAIQAELKGMISQLVGSTPETVKFLNEVANGL